MIQSLTARFNFWAQRWMPDPFIFAILLSLVVLLAGLLINHQNVAAGWGFYEAMDAWVSIDKSTPSSGLFKLLAFSMQMCLILVTGFALAETPLVRRAIHKLSSLPKNTAEAAFLVAFIAMVGGFLNWGFGLIVGALMARQVGISFRNSGKACHYPLVVAAGYMGLLVWHGGFSGSAPLKVTSLGDLKTFLGDLVTQPIATTATILSPMNIVCALILLWVIPLLFYFMAPAKEKCIPCPKEVRELSEAEEFHRPRTPASKMENSRLMILLPGLLILAYSLMALFDHGLWRKLDPNAIILVMLGLGLVLHSHPMSYLKATSRAMPGLAGIVLQFPFYAGIMEMMSQFKLTVFLSTLVSQVATVKTFPVITFMTAGVVNFFVPSGGGQWAVQGPIAMQGAAELGVDYGKTVMAVAWGDQWTNMLQPFWALALLGITGVKARDIIAYTAMAFLISGPIFCAVLYFA